MAKHNRDYKPEDIMFPEQSITESNLVEEMEKSYIEYAMSVIVGRALPDVRDGLKPVHRRILYTMYESGLTSDKPFKKSATCVGDVLGKYHPHGDSSVYDAMVRLAQNFSMRYMLVDGHGNFGSVDGDPPAAYRYTEARMSKLSNEMLRDIEKDTVNWDPNFDESRKEPRVLPSRFPKLHRVMLGRGLIADPGMLCPGGTTIYKLEAFHDALLEAYTKEFGGSRNAMFRMKENWRYMLCKFEGWEKLGKRLQKTTDLTEYKCITREIFHALPLLPRTNPDW